MKISFKIEFIKLELSKAAMSLAANRYGEAMEQLQKAQRMLTELMENVRPGVIDLDNPD
jgi:signal transduction histidine kinase